MEVLARVKRLIHGASAEALPEDSASTDVHLLSMLSSLERVLQLAQPEILTT
jgi:hypothetical protein